MKQKYLTISEMSKLTNLPIRTLHYYDDINLFKPVYVDPKTNYRYYLDSQIFQLDLIKSLKYIGTPLKSIKHAQSLTPEQLLQFLTRQEQIMEEKIKRMLEVQQALLKTKEQLSEQVNIKLYNQVFEVERSEQRLIAIKTEGINVVSSPDEYFAMLIKTVEREGTVTTTHSGGIYQLKPYESIHHIYYDYLYRTLLTERYVQLIRDEERVIVMEEGVYASIVFILKDDETYFVSYNALLEAVPHPLSPVYEVYMSTKYLPTNMTDYIVELSVKIKD